MQMVRMDGRLCTRPLHRSASSRTGMAFLPRATCHSPILQWRRISALDYYGEVPWTGIRRSRMVRPRMKSRPSFRPAPRRPRAGPAAGGVMRARFLRQWRRRKGARGQPGDERFAKASTRSALRARGTGGAAAVSPNF
jgi:hypothetical protein